LSRYRTDNAVNLNIPRGSTVVIANNHGDLLRGAWDANKYGRPPGRKGDRFMLPQVAALPSWIIMRRDQVPVLGSRYWVAIVIASMFGCNVGDFVSDVLHLGHVRGLPVLALVFMALLYAARRDPRPGEAYYWTVIAALRTAATNLSDLANFDLDLPFPLVIAGLAALLLILLQRPGIARMRTADIYAVGAPPSDGWFWATMLTAGTLGTAIGDYTAHGIDLHTGPGSLVLGAVLGIVLAFGTPTRWNTRTAYWGGIVAVRAFGTTAGDYLAFSQGINLGLPLSTAVTGALLVVTLILWRRPRVADAFDRAGAMESG
jgi:uncharacterized membrane-anchored protein